MDYGFVAEILREYNVQLRNYLNTSDTLAYLKYFTPHEEEKVRCKLRNDGRGPANDELINIVRIKPDTFIGLLASMKANQHHALFGLLWNYIQQRLPPEQVDCLHQCVTNCLESHQQVTSPLAIYQRAQLAIGAPSSPGLTAPGPPGVGPQQPQSLQDLKSHGEPLEPEGKQVDSLSKREVADVPLLPIQPLSLCARPDQNNFEDTELSNIKGRTMRNLGKELAKKDEDGTLRWEAVLDELHVDLTMEQEEIIRNYDSPGLKFLNVLGREKIKVKQLSEALRQCKLDNLNDILFERSADRTPTSQTSRSEENINDDRQSIGASGGGSDQMNIRPTSTSEENMQNQSAVEKVTNGFKNLSMLASPTTREMLGDTRSTENTDDSSTRDSVGNSESSSASGRDPNQAPVINTGTGNLPCTLNDPLESASPSYYGRNVPGETKESMTFSQGAEGSSVDPPPSEENYPTLKQRKAQVAADSGRKAAKFNPDVERQKLHKDSEHQSSVLGHNFDSHGYKDIQDTEQPTDNRRAPESFDPGPHSFDSVSGLHTPALELNIEASAQGSLLSQAGTGTTQVTSSQNFLDTGQQQESYDASSREPTRTNAISRDSGQPFETTSNLDNVEHLDTKSLTQDNTND